MADIVSVVNLKGGVGKTAISVNFAAYCGLQGLKTLLIDMDPQTNATFSCITVEAWKDFSKKNGTLANLMGARSTTFDKKITDPNSVIKNNVFKNVDLIPSHLEMFTIDLDISGAAARELVLSRALKTIIPNYEIIVCDCPPNLTIPTQNAIAMSSHYIVPVSPDYLSGIGVGLLLSRIGSFRDDLQLPQIPCSGIVLSRVGRPSVFREESAGSMRQEFPELILDAELKERSAVAESAAKQLPIYKMGDKNAIDEFERMSGEILTRMGYQ